jgi:hypothetical protein
MATLTPEEKYQRELLLSRTVLKTEMEKAIRAITPKERQALVARWKEEYKPEVARELLRVARNPEARLRIADWNLGSFDKERRVKKI